MERKRRRVVIVRGSQTPEKLCPRAGDRCWRSRSRPWDALELLALLRFPKDCPTLNHTSLLHGACPDRL